MPIVSDYWTILNRPRLVSSTITFSEPFYTGGLSGREQDEPYLEFAHWEFLRADPGVRAGTARFVVNGTQVGSLYIGPVEYSEWDFDIIPTQFHFDADILRNPRASNRNTLEITVDRGFVGLQYVVCHFKQIV